MRYAILLGLLACGGGKWNKPTATAEEFGRTKWDCRVYAKAINAANNPGQGLGQGFSEGMLFNECMRDHGWTK